MEKLLALHRYYIWANRLRIHFDSSISNPELTACPEEYFVNDCGLFLSHWYAALFVVVEGWQTLKLFDPEINRLLSSPTERVNDFATPCFMNLRCRVVLFQSGSFARSVG
jgi:hypothetical protein